MTVDLLSVISRKREKMYTSKHTYTLSYVKIRFIITLVVPTRTWSIEGLIKFEKIKCFGKT